MNTIEVLKEDGEKKHEKAIGMSNYMRSLLNLINEELLDAIKALKEDDKDFEWPELVLQILDIVEEIDELRLPMTNEYRAAGMSFGGATTLEVVAQWKTKEALQ